MSYDPTRGVDRDTILIWARAGIYPPPYCGAVEDPEQLLLIQSGQERWLDPPPLSISDEEAVEAQMQAFSARVGAGLMTRTA